MSIRDENIVYLTCNINEAYALTEVCQYFKNPLSKPIELSISFPIKQEIQFNKFIVTIGDKKVVSKILPKEKAKEKYNDSLSAGNTGFIGDYSDDGWSYNVLIGNISPKEKVILETSFLQLLTSNDMSYELSIMEKYPSFQYENMNYKKLANKKIKGKIIINTFSKITRLISFFLDETNKKKTKINYSKDYMEAIIEFEKEMFPKKNNEFKKPKMKKPNINILSKPSFFPSNITPKSFNMESNTIQPSFSILFRTEKMNIPIIYSQFDPEKKQFSYICNFVYSSDKIIKIPIPDKPDEDNKISYYNSFQNINENDTPGLFIFLIDQSGSMSGKSINLVKQALLLFIQSLPPKSYFQLIGFGSDFKYYNKTPVEYNKDNVENIIQVINNLDADMGGTNISYPLKDIFSKKNYDNFNLSKNIFLLTDGQVFDREECFNLISDNNSRFRIQSIGIGNDFDRVLIERCGKLGKGSSSFVINIEELNHIIIDTLNKCLRPYLTEINFVIKDINQIYIMPSLENIFYQDDILNYAFISNDKKDGPINIKFEANDTKNNIKKDFKVEKVINLEPGNELSKIIISNLLKISKYKKEEEIKLSKEYQVLSKNTSLFGEILKDGINTKGELIKVEINENNNNKLYCKKKACKAIKTKSFTKRMLFGLPIIKNEIERKSCKTVYKKEKFSGRKTAPMMKLDDMKCGRKKMKTKNIQSITHDFEDEFEDEDINNSPLHSENIFSVHSNKEKGNDFSKLIMKQDIIEGFWDENEYTLKIKNKLNEKFSKIENFVNGDKKIKNKKNAIFTILVLYYLLNDMKDMLSELRLIINKGKKYLNSINYNYDTIIQKIGI